jgi:hypothetical protein
VAVAPGAVVPGAAVAVPLAEAVGASAVEPAGELVAGPEAGDPQDVSISAMTIPEIAVTAGDADRRIEPSLRRLRRDDGLIVHHPTLGISWATLDCGQTVASTTPSRDSEAPPPRVRQRGFAAGRRTEPSPMLLS